MRLLSIFCILSFFTLASCGGNPENKPATYFITVEGSSIGENKIEGKNYAKLITDPLTDLSGKTLTISTNQGQWIAESIEHFKADHIFPVIQIIETQDESDGNYRILSSRSFRDASIQQLSIKSRFENEVAEYIFNFSQESENIPTLVNLYLPDNTLRFNTQNLPTKFLQLKNFNGDSTISALNTAIELTSYTTTYFNSVDSGRKEYKISVTSSNLSMFEPLTAYIQDRINATGIDKFTDFALSHYSSQTGDLQLRFYASSTVLANLSISSGDYGDEVAFDVIPLFYIVTQAESYASGEPKEFSSCINISVTSTQCPPTPDIFHEVHFISDT